ncbi:MAG: hypothetical protein AAF705_07015, partial [Bacteroidota bacterium]
MHKLFLFQYLLIFAFIILSTFTSSFYLHGQATFLEGQVILNNGDTLNGLIGISGSNRRYRECLFRTGLKADTRVINPEEAKAYLVKDRSYFISQKIEIEPSVEQIVFLEYILKGKASLLKHQNQYFLAEEDQALKKIPYRADAEQGNIDQARNRKQQLEWFDFLNGLKADCPELTEYYADSRNVKANAKNLTEIIRRYNACQGSLILEPGKDLPLAKVDIGIALSINRAN